jgi:16S rRNA (guanine527-N7)-methyltransferase
MTPERSGSGNVSRETSDRLELYLDLLAKWNKAINLVAKSTILDAWSRHFLDSSQLFPLGRGQHWADLGSGGGFPGMVVAILAIERRPNLLVSLVEADQRKFTFLQEVARQTGAKVNILNARSEDVAPLGADTLSARAFAPLPRLLAHVDRHMKADGIALFPKGARYSEEVAEARNSWKFSCEAVRSETDSQAVILKIQGVSRA